MPNQIWIDHINLDTNIGEMQCGFLGTVSRLNGAEYAFLSLHPCRTNMSHRARAFGWCGTTNDSALYADGIWRVQRINYESERVLLERVTSDFEISNFLADVGWLELGGEF